MSPLRVSPLATAVALACALPAAAQVAAQVAAQTADTVSAIAPSQTVVITATRAPLAVDDALADISVISRDQIDAADGLTLAQLLAREAGIEMASYGGWGHASSLFVRGLDARHVLLLIDGVRYGSATFGQPVWENLPLDAIERIEVVRGPLSGLWGSDAVAGVVHIITRRAGSGLAGHASLGLGSNSTWRVGAGVRGGNGAVDGALSVSAGRTDGFSATNENVPWGAHNPDRDGFDQRAVTARLGVALPESWRLDASLLASRGTVHYDDGPGSVDTRAALRSSMAQLQAAGRVAPGWRMALQLGGSRDVYETIEDSWGTSGAFATRQQQLSWINTLDAGVAGQATLLAESVRQQVSAPPGQAYDVASRRINAVAAGLHGRSGMHTWQANLRRDSNSQFGGQTTGNLGWGLAFTPDWQASASLGTSFIAPSFNELYYPGFGNPALQPAEGRHAELGLHWKPVHELQLGDAAWQASAGITLYAHRIRGFITPGPNPGNVDARVHGATLAAELTRPGWRLAASWDHVKARTDAPGTPNDGKPLPRRAPNAVKLDADTSWGAWQLGASVAAYSGRWDDAAATVRLSGYALLDARIAYRLSNNWTAGLTVNNVTDNDYQTAYGYNQPARNWNLTVRYDWK